MKKIFTFVALILIFFNFNNKAFSIEADVFVQSTVNRAAKTLGGGLTKEERIEKLKEININTTKVKIFFIFLT
jgi:phospholipid transport system substrate-binding protein